MTSAEDESQVEPHSKALENGITAAAERYFDIPLGRIKTREGTGVIDNSHLFNLIYREAAEQAGLRYLGYAPMKKLLQRTTEVASDDVRVGDLLVLKNGLAAMICRYEQRDKYHLIYVSQRRQRVIAFNTGNLVWEVYWLKNMKGFYRLTRYNFFSNP